MEYPAVVKIAAIVAKLNSNCNTENRPIVLITSCTKAMIAAIENCHSESKPYIDHYSQQR